MKTYSIEMSELEWSEAVALLIFVANGRPVAPSYAARTLAVIRDRAIERDAEAAGPNDADPLPAGEGAAT